MSAFLPRALSHPVRFSVTLTVVPAALCPRASFPKISPSRWSRMCLVPRRLQSLHPKVFPKRSQCGINSLGSLVFPEPGEGSDSVAALTVHRLVSAGPSAANRALSCFALRRGELNSELTGTTAYFKDRICPAARCRLSQFVSTLSFSSSSSGLKGSRLAQRSQGVCVCGIVKPFTLRIFSLLLGEVQGRKSLRKRIFRFASIENTSSKKS